MIFSLSEKQQAIQREIAELCTQLTDDSLVQRDQQCIFSRELWKILNQHKLDLLIVPERLGGRGYGAFDTVLSLETLGQHCADTGLLFALSAHMFACIHPLISFGNTDQIERWLSKIITYGLIGAHAITELEAGSDVFAMQTTATKHGSGYHINGQKCYITNAPVSDFLIVYARTGNNNNFFDFSAFILDRKTAGISINETPYEKIGLRTTAMGGITFDNVFVDEKDRLGREGIGGPMFQLSMEWERTCLFALYLGLMQRQLNLTLARAESRKQFGHTIGENQSISHKLADMYIRLETARLAVYKAAWHLDQGDTDQMSSEVAKLIVSEGAIKNALDAMQIHGAYGVLTGEIERQLRNTIPSTIFSGTTEVLKNNLAHQLKVRAKKSARG